MQPKKQSLTLIITIILLALTFAACKSRPEPQSGQRGNTVGNTVNMGRVAYDGEWIYVAPAAFSPLLKMRPDGSERLEIRAKDERRFHSINVIGDWIYYTSSSNGIRKVKTNGKGMEQITDDIGYYLNVIDDWIYYIIINDNDDDDIEDYIYKIRTDGTGREMLGHNGNDLNVVDDWIYYADTKNHNLYKMRTDGSENTLLYKDECGFLNVVDGWIYYCNAADGNTIYRVQIDGTRREQLCTDDSIALNVADGWIYYCNQSDGNRLYRIRTDGTGREILLNDTVGYIHVVGEWIYYHKDGPLSPMYRVRIDGTLREIIE